MYIMTPVLKTSRRLLLCNIVRYTFPNKAQLLQAVHEYLFVDFLKLRDIDVNDNRINID